MAQRTCVCGETFDVLSNYPQKRYCGRACGCRYRSYEERSVAARKARESRLQNLEDAFEEMTKQQAYKRGWVVGYSSGRWSYHYKRFLRRLLLALNEKLKEG